MKVIDLTGKKFGRFTVLTRADVASGGQLRWVCRCECGTEKIVRGAVLKNGTTRSCGCFQREARSASHTKHGLRKSDEYRIWRHIRTRCENENSPAFKDYGGRGIKVCERWLDFSKFYEDMGPRPSKSHSIDRKDNSRGYEPGNCRWATAKEQQRNRRDNLVFTVEGVTAPLAEHCEARGLNYKTVHRRLICGADISTALYAGRLPRNSIKTTAIDQASR